MCLVAVCDLEETVTVTGQTPVVDLQSTAKEITLSKEMLEAVPTGRLPQSYMVLVPGVVQSTENFGVGLHNSFVQANLQFHGGPTDSQVNADGFQTRHMNVVGGAQYSVNQGTVQEVVVSAGMASAEQQAGGVVSNAIPKERSEEHTSELQSQSNLVCRLLLEKKKKKIVDRSLLYIGCAV